MTVPVIAYLGIGSNLGDPMQNCRNALREISSLKNVQVLRRSSLYRTEPVGDTPQDWFVNGVVEVRTTFTAPQLLKALQWVEQALGRERNERWGPRTIDIDILLYGQEIIDTDEPRCSPPGDAQAPVRPRADQRDRALCHPPALWRLDEGPSRQAGR